MSKIKLIRTSTVPTSMMSFMEGFFEVLMRKYELLLVSSPEKELDEFFESENIVIVHIWD